MIIVEGTIRGKQRPKFFSGHATTPTMTLNYENWVKACYKEQGGRYLEGEIRAKIIAYYKVPKSYSKKRLEAIREGLEHPQKRPDADNIGKIILDSLNKIAYNDDSQVVELKVYKRWTEELERVEIELKEI